MVRDESLATTRQEAVQLPAVVGVVMSRCFLCGAAIPEDVPPLCPSCERDVMEKWDDHRAERDQRRRPL